MPSDPTEDRDFGSGRSPADTNDADGADGGPSTAGGGQKAEARAAVDAFDPPAAQRAAANRAIGRATTSSTVDVARQGDDIVVRVARPGRDGYQLIEHVVSPDGSKRVVQYAYDSSGRLVHLDLKSP